MCSENKKSLFSAVTGDFGKFKNAAGACFLTFFDVFFASWLKIFLCLMITICCVIDMPVYHKNKSFLRHFFCFLKTKKNSSNLRPINFLCTKIHILNYKPMKLSQAHKTIQLTVITNCYVKFFLLI